MQTARIDTGAHLASTTPAYQEDTQQYEEPMFIYKLELNPNYVPKDPQPTPNPVHVPPPQYSNSRIDDQGDPSQQDPSLYPYLYVLSSYLPKTQHSLVVAKKSS